MKPIYHHRKTGPHPNLSDCYIIGISTNTTLIFPFPYLGWVWYQDRLLYRVGGWSEEEALENAKDAIRHKCQERYIYRPHKKGYRHLSPYRKNKRRPIAERQTNRTQHPGYVEWDRRDIERKI